MKSKQTALLVIDMQNDFIADGALLEIKGIRKNIPKLRNFIDKCKNKGIKIIYTRHTYNPKDNPIEAKLFPELKYHGLRKNSAGWEIWHELKLEKKDTIINKPRYDAFYKTKLNNILKNNKISNLIITGTMTEVCCETTARSAMMQDYNIQFMSDLCFTSNKTTHNNTLKTIKKNFGEVLKSSTILKKLN